MKHTFFLLVFFCTSLQAQNSRQLPVIKITTQGNAEITSREIWTTMTSFTLIDPNNPENNIAETNPRNQIRGRGNTTWTYPKRPYRVRFRENTSLFGLRAHRNWILLAEYLDPTFLTTAVAFELGRNVFGLPFTNSAFHVHVYLNGRYDGIYTLTEHRQAAPDNVGAPGRAEIHPTNGWFVELDVAYDEDPKFRTRNYDLPILIKIPDIYQSWPGFPSNEENSDDPFYDFIKNDWNQLCDLMACGSFPENGYRDLIDMTTFVDFLMINEIVRNWELSHPKSVFSYKNTNEKISMGPIWDFDWAFSMAPEIINGGYNGTHSFFTHFTGRVELHPFFRRFFQDTVFVAMYKERWNEKYSKVLDVANFINEMGAKLEADVAEDTERWRFEGGYRSDYPTNYLAEITKMRTWWINRVNWLNMVINAMVTETTVQNPIVVENSHPLQVFPNPVINELRLTIDELRIGETVELFDMTGRRVASTPLSHRSLSGVEGSITIDMSPFQSGNYILRIGNRTAKIVKK